MLKDFSINSIGINETVEFILAVSSSIWTRDDNEFKQSTATHFLIRASTHLKNTYGFLKHVGTVNTCEYLK